MKQNKSKKKQLKRFDLDVVSRLLTSLYESGTEKKTNIARNSRMGYDKCVRYLECMELMDFAKKSVDENGYDVYDLTVQGIKFCKKKLTHRFNQTNLKKNDFEILV